MQFGGQELNATSRCPRVSLSNATARAVGKSSDFFLYYFARKLEDNANIRFQSATREERSAAMGNLAVDFLVFFFLVLGVSFLVDFFCAS